MKTKQNNENASADEHKQPPLTNEKPSKSSSGCIVLSSTDGFSVVKVNDIVRCEADANYTRVIFSNGKTIMASRNLLYFEQLLEDLFFVRIHHKYLVNLTYVRRYIKGRGGVIELQDGSQVEVSTRKKEDFLGKLSKFARGIY